MRLQGLSSAVEHFPSVYLLTFMMVRAVFVTSDQPSLVPAQYERNNPDGSLPTSRNQPVAPVRRYPYAEIRCAACSNRLNVTVYDPMNQLFHAVKVGCPSCQDIDAGVVMHHGERLVGSLLRTSLAV